MRTLRRPLGLAVAILFGGSPAIAAACQWSCASAPNHIHSSAHPAASSAHAHHHAAHLTTAPVSTELSNRTQCDHPGFGEPAIASSTAKVVAPIALLGDQFSVSAPTSAWVLGIRQSGSPPGARSSFPALRI